jgi:hypothetical protein
MTRIFLAAALVLAVACAKGDTAADTAATAAAPTTDRATAAATISNAIAANPAAADSILTANGYTRETFQQALFDIASDSVQSATYAAAKAR